MKGPQQQRSLTAQGVAFQQPKRFLDVAQVVHSSVDPGHGIVDAFSLAHKV